MKLNKMGKVWNSSNSFWSDLISLFSSKKFSTSTAFPLKNRWGNGPGDEVETFCFQCVAETIVGSLEWRLAKKSTSYKFFKVSEASFNACMRLRSGRANDEVSWHMHLSFMFWTFVCYRNSIIFIESLYKWSMTDCFACIVMSYKYSA